MADLEWLQAASGGFALLGGGALVKEYGYLMHRPTRVRRKLAANLELLAKLPEDSQGHKALETAIDAQAKSYAALLQGKQPWDPVGLTAVAILFLAALGLWVGLGNGDHWWFVPARILSVICAVVALGGLAVEIGNRSSKSDDVASAKGPSK